MIEDKSALLISGDTGSWTDGTRIEVSWKYEILDSNSSAYKASAVRIAVYPPQLATVKAIEIHLLERWPRSGVVYSQLRGRLSRSGPAYATQFDWNSTLKIPQQELYVTLTTTQPDEPVMMLKDSLSKRFSFLLSFPG
jgi:hypothetical protein